NWPSNVATVCATPGPPPASDPFPVHLSAQDRGTSNATYDHLTLAVASYESSAEVSPFSSKFDAWLAGNAQLSASEQRGYDRFNGAPWRRCTTGSSRCPHCVTSICGRARIS